MGDATMLGGKAKDRTEGEDVSMVTICQNGPMLKGEVGLHEAARNGDNVNIESLLDQGWGLWALCYLLDSLFTYKFDEPSVLNQYKCDKPTTVCCDEKKQTFSCSWR